jgi:acetyl-CoA carboxylase, biotin carboxylase subunit
MFRRILIANRGEVVARVLRTTRRMGIEAVVVVSEADRDAPYTRDADQVVCLGPPPSGESYLDRLGVIQAARQTGATAIHPGWGFLAEDALFADMCRQHGLTFIGPTPGVMRLMGGKLSAKQAAAAAGLDVIPGSKGICESAASAKLVAAQVGYPVLLKADAGGGGRGMRLCRSEADFDEAYAMASAEGLACFGSGDLYLEKYVDGGRHIEIQVLADGFGNAIHLGERECSVQRKHQKLLEESPSPALDDAAREAAGRRAAEATAAFGYSGAGTIEFLLDGEGVLRFIEMNTRLQVEHPVTELRCGLDLVEQQLRVACNEPLGLTQEDVRLAGHSIEVRLNAEDPANGFRPSPGKIERLILPAASESIRVDTHVEEGYVVTPHYDSLVAKVIAHGPDRESCIATMKQALGEWQLDGLPTTKPVFDAILSDDGFLRGEYDTRSIPGWKE